MGRLQRIFSRRVRAWAAEEVRWVRVLVVEDEKRLAAALRRGLEDEGFAVDVALDGHGGAVDGDGAAVRRDRPGRDAARPQRL